MKNKISFHRKIVISLAVSVVMFGVAPLPARAADPQASLVGAEDAVKNNLLVEGGESYRFQLGLNDTTQYSVEAFTADTNQCTISKDGKNFGAVFTYSDKVKNSKPTKMTFDTWVKAVDDQEADGTKNCRVTYRIKTNNVYYDGLNFPVDLAIADNDAAATVGAGLVPNKENGYVVGLLLNGMKPDMFKNVQSYEKDFITITGRSLPGATVHLIFVSSDESRAFVVADEVGQWQYIASSLSAGEQKLDIQVVDEEKNINGLRQTVTTFSVLPAVAKQPAKIVNQKNYTVLALIAAITLISLAAIIGLVVFMRNRQVVKHLKTELKNRYPAPAQVNPAAYAAYSNVNGQEPASTIQPNQTTGVPPQGVPAQPGMPYPSQNQNGYPYDPTHRPPAA